MKKSSMLRELYGVMQVTEPEFTPTLSDAVNELIQSKKNSGRREIYITSLRQYLNMFIRGQENKRIGEFTMTDIERWFVERNEAPSTRNSNVGRLSALFQWAWRRGYLLQNPCRRMEKTLLDSAFPEILTVDQCERALCWTAQKEPRFLAWLVLTMMVGLRPESEADIITWSEIKLESQVIRISGEKTKTRRHRIITLDMMPVAGEWLALAKGKCGEWNDLPMVYMARRRYIQRLKNFLGLKAWPQDLLRHTAASYLFAYHQDAGKVAAFLGNSAGVLLNKYRALVDKADAEKFFTITPQILLTLPKHALDTMIRKPTPFVWPM